MGKEDPKEKSIESKDCPLKHTAEMAEAPFASSRPEDDLGYAPEADAFPCRDQGLNILSGHSLSCSTSTIVLCP